MHNHHTLFTLWAFVIALFMYGSACVIVIQQISRFNTARMRYLYGSIIVGLFFHAAILLPNLLQQQYVYFSAFNSISVTTWLMLLFALCFSLYRPVWVLTALAIPLTTLGLMAGMLQTTGQVTTLSPTPMLLGHIAFSLAAYCLLFMASVQCALLYWQSKQLKNPSAQLVLLDLLPPLIDMEALLFDMIFVGFGLLTCALTLGFISIDNIFAQHLAHKTFFSILSWLFFAGLIVGRLRFGLRGKYAIRYTLVGFFFLLLSFWGTKIILSILYR